MGVSITNDDSLDKIFVEVGEFKRYQVLVLVLLFIPSLLSAGYCHEFMFASATLSYR